LRINEPTRPTGWVCEVDITISDIVDAMVAYGLSARSGNHRPGGRDGANFLPWKTWTVEMGARAVYSGRAP